MERKAKKIGLLTYHNTTNFGSLLQTYALAKTVNKMGYICEVIDYHNSAVEERESSKKLWRCRNIRALRDYFKYEPFKKRKEAAFKEFTRNNLYLSKVSYNLETVRFIGDTYDCYLVGSDLVWDFSINDYDYTYMLDFVDKSTKKIAYASSVGKIWEQEDRDSVKSLLERFEYIGVREREIKLELNKIFDIAADFVCDPTMLITSEEWKLMASPRLISEKYVLCYFSDDELRIYEDAIRYGEENNLPVYLISYDWVPRQMNVIRPAKVEDFLSLVMNAEAVFTASYHGMLFSLYFNKEFFFYNRGWKSRMSSLAKYLDVLEREHYRKDKVTKPLDYNLINSRIDQFRMDSLEKLSSYLDSEEGRINE